MPSVMSFSELPSLVPNSLSRPANILLPTWNHGRPAALDIHVISSLQQQTVGEAASTPGHALQVGVQCKLVSHLSACRSAGVDFIPIVTEVLGRLAEDTISIICAFGEAIGRSRPQSSTTCTKLHHHPILPPSVDGLV